MWLFAIGCSDYSVVSKDAGGTAGPEIDVTPTALTFGPLATGESAADTFLVKNDGTETLHVTALRLRSGETAFTVLTDAPFDVEPGQEVPVDVAFSPPTNLTYGEILVVSDDADEPEVPVVLEGLGQVPALEILPGDHIFASQCEDRVMLTFENVGLDVLTVTGAEYDAPADLTFAGIGPFPFELQPGQSVSAAVDYVPLDTAPVMGTITVHSDDPRGDREATQTTEGVTGDATTETFTIEANPPIDILFALDKSCSMSDDNRGLANAFEDFIADVDAATTAWRIGVVSKSGGCFNEGIIRPSDPDYQQTFLDAVTSRDLVTAGDLTEALLALTDKALLQMDPGECNEGFVRTNALLHIVTVSDEPEQSGEPWDHWVTRTQGGKGDPGLVVYSVVADLTGCESGAAGYTEAAAATGGLALDICRPNWPNFAAQLGAASAQALQTFLLASIPDPSTIEVSIDGQTTNRGWSYDPVRNAIIIEGDQPEGTEIEVTYASVGCE